MAVIGMGRLGGERLGYGSDADVLFVCDPEPGVDENRRQMGQDGRRERAHHARLTQPGSAAGSGRRLRPRGTQRSDRAHLWRPTPPTTTSGRYRGRSRRCCAHQVAGDNDLGIAFLHMADRIRYPEGGVSGEAVKEIRRIKARVDSERLRGR